MGGGGGWSKLIFLTMNPNLNRKIYFCGGPGEGGGAGGTRVNELFYKESKSRRKKKTFFLVGAFFFFFFFFHYYFFSLLNANLCQMFLWNNAS